MVTDPSRAEDRLADISLPTHLRGARHFADHSAIRLGDAMERCSVNT